MDIKELKKGDIIYNVTYDKFKKYTIDSVYIKEFINNPLKECEIIHFKTTCGNNIFFDSRYIHKRWYTTEKSAEEARKESIEWNTEQIERHNQYIKQLQKGI